jgi:hypothetical protein
MTEETMVSTPAEYLEQDVYIYIYIYTHTHTYIYCTYFFLSVNTRGDIGVAGLIFTRNCTTITYTIYRYIYKTHLRRDMDDCARRHRSWRSQAYCKRLFSMFVHSFQHGQESCGERAHGPSLQTRPLKTSAERLSLNLNHSHWEQ